MNKSAYILFTRVPVANKVKTRLQSSLSGEEASQVQLRMLQDSFKKFSDLEQYAIDGYLAYSDEGDPTELLQSVPKNFQTFRQQGKTIGERMNHAMQTVFAKGYEKVVLTGSDIPNLNTAIILTAFSELTELVFGPSFDGGYYLVGSTSQIDLKLIFETEIAWGKKKVLQETLQRLSEHEVSLLPPLQDIDYPSDLKRMQENLAEENHYLHHWLIENRGVLE
ncbi:TIGR04282 family arsenosugar biosynthesis glycosyltransferase [Enterococcus pseudoavium]|uniref:TIGR04282 family arsenosugar biosynthesis glycosyltransferase n=1 Tax=Enterococcus pseudoavium TaxID=44007 RepID=A0AAE4I330_9ENTE|nr:TIGR04282 family arsenosugar biosynthesis glycosyltransferase [Enterococcus pseudoavium]MDT2738008.1 TIGR04282 family arsenosugar biosynthesis glycosyltransferase [Enterococcus pseudoavium]MDT2753704.1 TIGR04282 family arsenosugar biosynthesis glycosyltransferase [Enterococcus pseudoavium]MDT2771287.1 TIGR04282 family arsenosugar biosynthesis glycosyltransferase [Enterococcus pseudoavium]